MTQVQHQLDNPTYVISEDEEIRRGQEAWWRLKNNLSWSDWTAVRQFCLKAINIDLAQQIKESQNSEAKATSCRFWSTRDVGGIRGATALVSDDATRISLSRYGILGWKDHDVKAKGGPDGFLLPTAP